MHRPPYADDRCTPVIFTKHRQARMITKTYTSRGVIIFSRKIGQSNKTFRFSPSPVGGGSMYTTSSQAEQEALENHPDFGSVYVLAGASGTQEPAAEEKPQARSIKVSDVVEARDYLMDLFGYKANDLRSRKAIMEAGAEHGIAFEGI